MVNKAFDSSNFHTALRKALDSTASSIAWNAVHLLEREDWDIFCYAMKNNPHLPFRERYKENLWYGQAARNLFLIGLEMLTDDEWDVLEKYSFVEAVNEKSV